MSKPLDKCPLCGKEVRNLGAHMHQAHRDVNAKEYITDKELATTLLKIKQILNRYRYTLETRVQERNGTDEQVQLLVTIQMK